MTYSIDKLTLGRKSWLKLANIPAKFVGWKLEDCVDLSESSQKELQGWVSKVKTGFVIRAYGGKMCGRGLLFAGSPGLGKSTVGAALLQEMITTFPLKSFDTESKALSRPVYFTSYTGLISLRGQIISGDYEEREYKLWHGILGDCKDDSFNIRVLVIDDVGAEHNYTSGWQKSLLHEVLRGRYEKGLPTIITSNTNPKDWKDLYSPATQSFLNEAFFQIRLATDEGDLRLRNGGQKINPGIS